MTPMMEQYFDIKQKYKYYLIFFRLGDFYELFFDDALIASKELEITLTGRDCGMEERAPMCGVPYHSVDGYIAKLIEKGYKVAICEQTEDPKKTKTIVKREVVRIITPGTVIDPNMLDEGKNNYIMCVFAGKDGYGLTFCDVTTGEFSSLYLNKEEEKKIEYEIAKYNPSEIIANEDFKMPGITASAYYMWAFEYNTAQKKLLSHFKLLNLNSYDLHVYEVRAAGALMEYLSETQKNSLSHICKINSYKFGDYLMLDTSSRRNLELTETMREKSKKGSMLWVLDKTKTAMGARLLRKYIEQPLINIYEINRRLNAVGELKADVISREEIRENLSKIFDIERILSKIIYQTANARDLNCLKDSLKKLPGVKYLMQGFSSGLLTEMYNALDTLEDIQDLIENAIEPEPPFSIREGGIIKDGYDEQLDKHREAKRNGNIWLEDLEAKEREATGIKTLKIKYNKIFGYCIEITNSYIKQAPERYIRRQTLSNCERYITPELKEIEDSILGAEDKLVELEYDFFVRIREQIAAQAERVRSAAQIVAALDVLQSLGDAADKNGYTKPVVDGDGIIDIKESRHPVVEKLTEHRFVPNDIFLDMEENRLSIITGPNMAGKSTYMRQAALIVLMAQVGSFVPAESAKIGVVDKIFTRVGASDDLATGQSTFMVEMTEVANILNNATQRSLLILDEIGRGTSTFDGLSIAWAVLEYIADNKKIGAKTLFATHYHELTELEGKIEGVKNYCITVLEQGEDIIFMRKIVRGGADNSYGIQVARLAGLPAEVITRSKIILSALDNADVAKQKSGSSEIWEEVRFGGELKEYKDKVNNYEVTEKLRRADIDALSAREALQFLYELQGMCKTKK